jgi:hypothetical protein
MTQSTNSAVVELSSQINTETNERIYMRNIPSKPLQPYLDVRPCNTKYTMLPVVEPRILNYSVPLQHYPIYNIQQTFNPGNTQSPYSGYSNAINIESELKGQIYALQKCSQSVYIPQSSSDLYQDSYFTQTTFAPNADKHSLLFHKENFNDFNPNPNSGIVGTQIWGNATRAQMQEVPDNYCAGNGLFQTQNQTRPITSSQHKMT